MSVLMLILSSSAGVGLVVNAQINQGPWYKLGNPIVGTNNNRNIGQVVLHPSSNVMVEAHETITDGSGGGTPFFSPSSMEISVYLYEQDLYDWIPFGDHLTFEYDTTNYDVTSSKISSFTQ